MSDFRENLKRLRARVGLSQQKLAEMTGLSITVVRQFEQGRASNPRLETLRSLARVLGTSLDELAGNASPATPPRKAASKR